MLVCISERCRLLSLSLLNSTKKSLGSEGFSFGALTRNDYIIIFLLRHVIIKRLILWGDNAVQHFASLYKQLVLSMLIM